jgi:hypothetical protein
MVLKAPRTTAIACASIGECYARFATLSPPNRPIRIDCGGNVVNRQQG